MKKILVIQCHSPFDGIKCREALDMSLIFAAIDQQVSILFKDDAVYCLTPAQAPERAQLKNYFKTLKMLELYDVENIYACEASLKSRGLAPDNLHLSCEIVSHNQVKQIIKQQDHMLSL